MRVKTDPEVVRKNAIEMIAGMSEVEQKKFLLWSFDNGNIRYSHLENFTSLSKVLQGK